REQEVVDIMTELFDQEEVFRSYLESERNDTKIEMAREMILGNEPIDKIVRYSGLSKEIIQGLQREQLQPV
ncbi:MAG: hypothetical protein NC307_15930, partial [Roseburia sp.]|nr:hypothetical protein [Roseburia sp.]